MFHYQGLHVQLVSPVNSNTVILMGFFHFNGKVLLSRVLWLSYLAKYIITQNIVIFRNSNLLLSFVEDIKILLHGRSLHLEILFKFFDIHSEQFLNYFYMQCAWKLIRYIMHNSWRKENLFFKIFQQTSLQCIKCLINL